MTVDEFTALLATTPLEDVVRDTLFAGAPFIFEETPDDYQALRDHLSGALGVAVEQITVVGSAKMGFSLDPGTYGRAFSDESDVDVVIVDEALFDRIWFTLLRWHYPRRLKRLAGVDRGWSVDRQRSVYWGWFVPNRIRYDGVSVPTALEPLRDLGTQWFEAFRSIALNPRLAGRDFGGRLYRSWEHVMLYHTDGLRSIKDSLFPPGEAPGASS